MKKILLYIWQLPQNILGIILRIVFFFIYGEPEAGEYNGIKFLYYDMCRNGISLGDQVLMGKMFRDDETDNRHEYGHTRQSLYLGPLYLILIGLPSFIGNIYDQCLHTVERGWSYERSYWWYYNQPWERWADMLGKAGRTLNKKDYGNE